MAHGSISTVLVVDDDPVIRDLLRETFEPLYRVLCADSGEAALGILAAEAVDLVLTDQRMPGMTGLAMLEHARQRQPDLVAILLTAYTDPQNLIAAINAGHVFRYVVKPWDTDELLMTVRNALETAGLRRERAGLTARLARRLDAMRVLVDLGVEAAATTTYTQLIEVVTRSLKKLVNFDVAATLVVPQGSAGPAAMHLHCRSPADEATLLETRDRAVELYSERSDTVLGEGQLLVNVSGERVSARVPDVQDGGGPGSRPVQSVLQIPLTVDGQVVGALVLVSYAYRAFTEDDSRTLDVLAKQTGQAVRRLQARLLDERRKMALMVEAMADGLVMTDGGSEVFLINPAARRLLGLPPDEPITAQYLKETLGFYPFDLVRGSPTVEPVREELRIGERVLHSIVSPVVDSEGTFVGVVVVLRDITSEKMLEQRKDEFVSIVSHELRTPLTAITGALDIVLSQYPGGLSEKQLRYLELARESSGTLNKIVDDLLDVAKSERGKLTMRMGAIDLAALVRAAVERFRPPAESKQVQVVVRAPKLVRVVGDADRLGQVLNNLLANAIKFTPEKGRVQITVFGPPLSSGYAGVSVWNHGDPIPAEARERVFEKFEQLESSTTRRVGGTGLGLAIARGIVERHGGRIWVEPITDGTKFVFTMPVTPPDEDQGDDAHEMDIASRPAAPPASAHRVLVVAGDQEARLLLKGMLLAAGYGVDTAADGDEALVMAREHKPDAVSMDAQMPGAVDGLSVVEILKHDPETRGIPVVVLSAGEDRERALGAGADAWMPVPIEPQQYTSTLTRLVTERGRARQKVLLVDDDPSIRMICREVLEGVGYAVAEAGGGADAQAEARRFRPDLIVLDVMMPDVDGFTLAQRLREERSTVLTPVIFLSARGRTADKVRAFKLGAEDYLVKPFDSAELLARVEKALARRDAELSASPTTKLPGSNAIEAEIDRRLALAHSGGADFAFCYLDLDNLKAFNDYYGYAKADGVIRQTGDIIRDCVAREGSGSDFIGHIAGDDFVFITSVERVDRVCRTVAQTFDRLVPLYYNKSDREKGYIETNDRYGVLRRFPIMTVSIAAVTRTARIRSHADLALTAAELKKQAKAIPTSAYVRDGTTVLPLAPALTGSDA